MRKRPNYQLLLLGLNRVVKAFEEGLTKRGQRLRFSADSDLDYEWESFIENIHFVAQQVLVNRKRTAIDAELDDARKRMHNDIDRMKRQRTIDVRSHYDFDSDYPGIDLDLVAQVGIRHRQYRELTRRKRNTVIEKTLSNIEKTAHISTRINQTCKLIRHYKRTGQSRARTTISGSFLHREMAEWDRGIVPSVENDHCPLSKPPSEATLEEIFATMKSGTAPGVDYFFPEFLKVPLIRKVCAAFVNQAYKNGAVPAQWHETSVILLPKITRPITYDDHRPITLCCITYKVYARYLLQELHKFIPPLPEYQNGFLENRSVDDALFFISRVAETHWNHSTPLYILALDLKKAFSLVDIHTLPAILLRRGVPSHLVNRIINACLYERSQITWQGHTTAAYVKTVGVKQGCPISPFLFVVILDEVLQNLKKKLSELNPGVELFLAEPDKPIKLPALAAYADDMTVLSTSLDELDRIVQFLVPELKAHGLEINPTKSELVLKSSDNELKAALAGQHLLGGLMIPTRPCTTILGVNHSHDMNRRTQIIDRCNKALRMYHLLVPILQPLKLEYAFLVRLYRALILPIMVFGLRHNSFTQSNKIILMHREVQMLRGLASIAHPRPKNATLNSLLHGRTINRVVTVGKLCYFAHIFRRPTHSLLKRSLCYRLAKKRKIGRPLYSFNTYMAKEFQSAHEDIRFSEWETAFAHALTTRALCQRLYTSTRPLRDPMSKECKLFVSTQ